MKTVTIEDKARIESIILHSEACSIAMIDLDGNPYVIPMNFGYEENVIYLHSAPEGHKIEMIHRNNNVCLTFHNKHELTYQNKTVACSYSMRSESVVCKGKVSFIEDMEEKKHALSVIMRHYTPDEFRYSDPAVRNVKVWKVQIEQLTGKIFGLRADENPE